MKKQGRTRKHPDGHETHEKHYKSSRKSNDPSKSKKPKQIVANGSKKMTPLQLVKHHHKQIQNLQRIPLPIVKHNLTDHNEDIHITAIIDIFLLCQVERVPGGYRKRFDALSSCRKKALPEGFPGVQCIHCSNAINSNSIGPVCDPSRFKRWFWSGPSQLATGLPKLEHHFRNCEHCPPYVVQQLEVAKRQEDFERFMLSHGGGHLGVPLPSELVGMEHKFHEKGKTVKTTRRHYADIVFFSIVVVRKER